MLLMRRQPDKPNRYGHECIGDVIRDGLFAADEFFFYNAQLITFSAAFGLLR